MSAALVIHHFGSKDGLRKACDDYIADEIRTTKSETHPDRTTRRPGSRQLAEIESYAPMMAYLVRSMQSGGDLAKMLWHTMIDNAEQYIEDGVRAGTVKPSRDPKARATFPGHDRRRRLPALCADARRPQRISAQCFMTTART